MAPSRLVNRNIVAPHGRTSLRMEPELWDAVAEICMRERISLRELLGEAQRQGGAGGQRTSALRVFTLLYFRAASTERGHARAGHGRADLKQEGG